MSKEEKKSFLERVGLVVEVPDSSEELSDGNDTSKNLFSGNKGSEANVGSYPTSTSSNAESSSNFKSLNVVQTAYATLPQSRNDIFVVEELLKNFSALPEEQRCQTLRVTLTTMGKNIDEFITEANARKNVILNTLSKTTEEIEEKSKQITVQISEARARIDSLNQENLDIKNSLDESKKESMAECQRLDNIIKVLGGQIGGN